jgi:hypothetical protein
LWLLWARLGDKRLTRVVPAVKSVANIAPVPG